MKMVGQKIRMMNDRVRYTALDELGKHSIGYHTDLHGGRPQPAEYMGPLNWLDGQEEFRRRELRGIGEIMDTFGTPPVCYGQPGSNWSPQVFPILRDWAIPAYVSGFGYVCVRSQPFWYGGIINTSHMYGSPGPQGEMRNHMTLGFDINTPDGLDKYMAMFDHAHASVPDGGLVSISNHPCQLVLKRWFSAELKTPEQRENGYENFERFVEYVLSHNDVRTITADELPGLYPDRAMHRVFGHDELLEISRALSAAVSFIELDDMALSAAETFGILTRFAARALQEDAPGPGEACMYLDGPAHSPGETDANISVKRDDFAAAVFEAAEFIATHDRLPDRLQAGSAMISPGDYLAALASVTPGIIKRGGLPGSIQIKTAEPAFGQYVSDEDAHGAWEGAMMPENFSAPNLLEQAYLQAWTLKPAILSDEKGYGR
jgi:hypothetical protein